MSSKKPNGFYMPYWITNKENGLGFSGIKLLLYCLIYSFSAGEEYGCWWGTQESLAIWLNTTEERISKLLKELTDEKYIIKSEVKVNNKDRIAYFINHEKISNNNENLNKTDRENLNIDNEKNSINNKDNNINNINSLERDVLFIKKENVNKSKEILDYFNKVCGTNFKYTRKNLKNISGRLSENFTIEDFKKVIDIKWLDWGKRPYKFHNGRMSNNFLKPDTLFGNKFENYLNEANLREIKVTNVSVSSDEEEEESELTF